MSKVILLNSRSHIVELFASSTTFTDKWSKLEVLVAGKAGFIGSHMVNRLIASAREKAIFRMITGSYKK